MKASSLSASLLFVASLLVTSNLRAEDPRPNILFIAIDDMNDWTGFLGGHPQTLTPNLDRLARRGVNFTNAHCSAPACSPSRLALLYGVQPYESGFYPFYDHDQIPPESLARYTSLPAAFRQAGYKSFGAGKIFHGHNGLGEDWNEYHQPQNVDLVYAPKQGYQQGTSEKMAFCPTTNRLEDHPDHQVASYGIDVLSRDHRQPFFLAVGIVKPHLAFVCPQQFYDALPDRITPPKIREDDLVDVPWVGRSMVKLQDDFRFRTDNAWEKVHRSYLACISWADYNIGRVLDALEASPYADNTIVVVWSDHGYHQGEKRSFRKFSLWEESTRVPFIVFDPRQNQAVNRPCTEAVSLIHIYRTLCDLSGISAPEYVSGTSLRAQLENPRTALNEPAVTTWGRGNYSVRDDHFRYIRYYDGTEELYDHRRDTNEWRNFADDADYAKIKMRLAGQLPRNEAPLIQEGVALWNVNDADRPQRIKSFKSKSWPAWVKKMKPALK